MKKEQKKIIQKIQSVLLVVIILFAFYLLQEAGLLKPDEKTTATILEKEKVEQIQLTEESLHIIYLNVGQADSIFIKKNQQVMLIDAGNVEDSEKIVNFLQENGIQRIDYLIGTHIHEDHIGGMDKIVENFDIGKIYLPYNTENTTQYYERLLTQIQEKKLQITKAEIGEEFWLEDTKCQIKYVDHTQPKEPNNASIVVQLENQSHTYLFMGDSEEKVEESISWEDIDVLKVGHHGSDTSSSTSFLAQVKPEIAIISVGEGNSYNLPKEEIVARLVEYGAKVYRTDQDGTIHLSDDGEKIEIEKVALSLDG